MNYYCTLFDSNYLTRGLAMYDSLIRTGEEFILYVFAFDDLAVDILNHLNLQQLKVVTLKELETDRLLEIKPSRTKVEYCWTCTPFVIGHILEHFQVPEVTYLDADLYFFNKPELLLTEFRKSNCDVLLTEHRYTPEYDQTQMSGIYCVQFMTFRNTENGLYILKWWQDRCAEWCFYRFEDGKIGDQKYLDDWLTRFSGVHVLQNIGGGVAPWNIQQYRCTVEPKVNEERIVFYHFHGLTWLKPNKFDFSSYQIGEDVVKFIYEPYFKCLQQALKLVQSKYMRSFRKGFSIDRKTLENYFFRRMNRAANKNNMQHILKNILGNKEGYVVFGAGDIGQEAYEWFKKGCVSIKYFVDNSPIKQAQKIDDIAIQNPNILRAKQKQVIIVIAVATCQEEIKKQIQDMGFNEQGQYFSLNELKETVIQTYINKNMKWIFDAPKYGGVIKL